MQPCLLPKILAGAGENADLKEIAAKIAWRRVAGEGLRDHAVPSRLQEKTLVVSVADAVWQKQLQPMSVELIFRINKLLRQKVVERIEFRIDPRALNASYRATSFRRLEFPSRCRQLLFHQQPASAILSCVSASCAPPETVSRAAKR